MGMLTAIIAQWKRRLVDYCYNTALLSLLQLAFQFLFVHLAAHSSKDSTTHKKSVIYLKRVSDKFDREATHAGHTYTEGE